MGVETSDRTANTAWDAERHRLIAQLARCYASAVVCMVWTGYSLGVMFVGWRREALGGNATQVSWWEALLVFFGPGAVYFFFMSPLQSRRIFAAARFRQLRRGLIGSKEPRLSASVVRHCRL